MAPVAWSALTASRAALALAALTGLMTSPTALLTGHQGPRKTWNGSEFLSRQ